MPKNSGKLTGLTVSMLEVLILKNTQCIEIFCQIKCVVCIQSSYFQDRPCIPSNLISLLQKTKLNSSDSCVQ